MVGGVWNDGKQVCLCRLYVYNKTVAFEVLNILYCLFEKKLTNGLHWFILVHDVWNDDKQVCLCRYYVYNKNVAFEGTQHFVLSFRKKNANEQNGSIFTLILLFLGM